MDRPLVEFVQVLRHAGVRVSTAEVLDALHALDLTGCGSRDVLQNVLAAVLAKSSPEQVMFINCFDCFFAADSFPLEHQNFTPHRIDELALSLSSLSQLVLSGDRGGLAFSMQEAANSVDLSSIQFFTQKGPYIQKILQRMGFNDLSRDVETLSALEDSIEQVEQLKKAKDELFQAVKKLVDRQFDLYTPSMEERLSGELARVNRLSNHDECDFQIMQTLVRKMVKRLKTIYSRRRKMARRGHLDFKRTFRGNIAHQGLLFDISWKTKKVDRPEVVAICDISRSVRTITRFFLLFLYSLNEIIGKIKTFVFCSNLVEVSAIFAEYPVDTAISKIEAGTGLGISFGLTDYGLALREFKNEHLGKISQKTTVFILGDARNNYDDPRSDILGLIHRKSKRVIWLNPESPFAWGSGDSAMHQYTPYCDLAMECNTLGHLQKIVRNLLKSHQ